jgi:hypothetical protein
MCSTRDNVALPTLGFPIRASAGHWLFSASPRLIAAVHALLRLLVPRHPPCALTILTVILGRALRLRPVIPVSLATVQFSRSAKRRSATQADMGPRSSRQPASRRSLKTQQHASRLAWTLRSNRAACQIRSTCLVADRSRESVAELESSGRRSAGDRCPLVVEGSLERR